MPSSYAACEAVKTKRGERDGPGSSVRAFSSTALERDRDIQKAQQRTVHAYAPGALATHIPATARTGTLSCNLPAARSPVFSPAHTPAPPPPPQT
jgi:hypothetical protein